MFVFEWAMEPPPIEWDWIGNDAETILAAYKASGAMLAGVVGERGAEGPQGPIGPSGASGVLPSVKTANHTAANGDYILADTTSGAFTVTLPASPTTGAAVRIIGNGWSTNNLTVARNGQTIEGVADDLLCNYDAGLTFIFIGGTWRY